MKTTIKFFAISVLAASLTLVHAADPALTTESQKFSYSLGYGVASQYKKRLESAADVQLDPKAFIQAIEDVFANGKQKLTDAEMRAVMQTVGQRLQAVANKQKAETEEKRKMTGGQNKKLGEAYLAENKKKPGVKVTDSGLQYEVLTAGTGRQPKQTDTVVVNYRGTLINGTEFDSSYKRNQPATFALNGIIKGWQEALQLMKVGSKWKIVLPAEIAYGARGAGASIGPGETLVFEIELLEVK